MKKEHYLKPTIRVVGMELNGNLMYTSVTYNGDRTREDIYKGYEGETDDPYGGIEE